MPEYAILCNPSHNRVYFKESLKMAASELAVVSSRVSARLHGVGNRGIAGIDYLAFSAETALAPGDINVLSDLSFAYAIFEIGACCGGAALRPIQKTDVQFVDSSISSILKYTGKTNEVFTRLLINAAYYSQGVTSGVKLLDPVAGKCTTLFEGLVRGFDVYGIEVGDNAASEACNFLKKFLETEKYKHSMDTRKLTGPNRSYKAVRHSFEIARTKDEQKGGDVRRAEIIAANSVHAGDFYKKETFDIIAGDLPYGVQHGNVTNRSQSSATRNPEELLTACLPVWAELLKPGGAIALSWNVNVLRAEKIAGLYASCGLTPMDGAAYAGFAHRVDQSILRDIAVARKQ